MIPIPDIQPPEQESPKRTAAISLASAVQTVFDYEQVMSDKKNGLAILDDEDASNLIYPGLNPNMWSSIRGAHHELSTFTFNKQISVDALQSAHQLLQLALGNFASETARALKGKSTLLKDNLITQIMTKLQELAAEGWKGGVWERAVKSLEKEGCTVDNTPALKNIEIIIPKLMLMQQPPVSTTNLIQHLADSYMSAVKEQGKSR